MTLTHAQRKRLAREARGLGFASVDGKKFGPYYEAFGGELACALGELAVITGIDWRKLADYDYGWSAIFCDAYRYRLGDGQSYVFPLMAFADALEESP